MEATIPSNEKNISTFTHLSTFSKWFIPFGNFIVPIIIWSVQKNKSKFVDEHGRGVINFQLSLLLYALGLFILSIPFFIWQGFNLIGNDTEIIFSDHFHTQGDIASASGFLILLIIVGAIAAGILIFEIICVVSGAMSASRGEYYKYPLTINFIKASVSDIPSDEPTSDDTEVPEPQVG